MIEQSAIVLNAAADKVTIEVNRQTACGSCSAKVGCGKSLLDNVFNVKPLLLSIPNTLGAKENDDVIVGLNESAMLHASFYLYFFPLILMIIFAIVGAYLFSGQYSEIVSIAAAVIGLFWGARLSRGFLNKKDKNDFFQPSLVRIIHKTLPVNLLS